MSQSTLQEHLQEAAVHDELDAGGRVHGPRAIPLRDRLGRRRFRQLAIALGVVLALALSVPVGLMAMSRSGGGATSGDSQAALESPGAGPEVVAPGIPQPAYSGADGSSAQRDAAGAPSAVPNADKGAVPGAPGAQGAVAGKPDLAAAVGPRIARSAWLGVKVTDLVASSAKARLAATAAGGTVLSENVVTSSDPRGLNGGTYPGAVEDKAAQVPPVGVDEARLVLSVPTEKLDGLLNELSKSTFGTVSYRSSQSQDVTSTYVDTKARIQPAKDGIARIRALLLRATSLDQVVSLEAEISRRQADLDSLEQRMAELERMTSMSDVTVSLWTDATQRVEPEEPGNEFLGSLQGAWNALLGSLAVIVTGLAVLLPWLLIAALVAWVVLRARRRRVVAAPPAAD